MSVQNNRDRIIVDGMTGMLVGLFVSVQIAAVWVAVNMGSTGSVATATPAQQSESLTMSARIVAMIVSETILIVLAWRYASLLPEWLRTVIKWGVASVVGVSLFWVVITIYGALLASSLVTLFAGLSLVMKHYDLKWLLHNLLAFGLALVAAKGLGATLSPRPLLVFLVLLTVWDIVAVWKSGWMDGLIGAFGKHNIPAYFILPAAPQINMSRFTDWLGDRDSEKPNDVAGLLGVGDVAVPAAVVVSTVIAFPTAVYQPIIAATIFGGSVAMVSLRTAMGHGKTVPALPWISTGCVAGFIVGVLISSVSLASVFGGGI